MNAPSVHEKIEDDIVQDLTLEGLARRVETLASNINKIYEVLVKHTEDRTMRLAQEISDKENVYAQAFNMINATLAGYTGRFDAIADELFKLGVNKDNFIETAKTKTKEILDEQQRLQQKFMEEQRQFVQEEMKKQKQKNTNNLTELS